MDGPVTGLALRSHRVSIGLDGWRRAALRGSFRIPVRSGEGHEAGPAAPESLMLWRVVRPCSANSCRARGPGDVVEGGARTRAKRERVAQVVSKDDFACGGRGRRSGSAK